MPYASAALSLDCSERAVRFGRTLAHWRSAAIEPRALLGFVSPVAVHSWPGDAVVGACVGPLALPLPERGDRFRRLSSGVQAHVRRPQDRPSHGSPGPDRGAGRDSRRVGRGTFRDHRLVEQLEDVDTANVEPMTAATGAELRWRADEVTDGGIRERVVANAPDAENGMFAVPKVIE